jgi:hypothetical protein
VVPLDVVLAVQPVVFAPIDSETFAADRVPNILRLFTGVKLLQHLDHSAPAAHPLIDNDLRKFVPALGYAADGTQRRPLQARPIPSQPRALSRLALRNDASGALGRVRLTVTSAWP